MVFAVLNVHAFRNICLSFILQYYNHIIVVTVNCGKHLR
jgi:hypothetical protein